MQRTLKALIATIAISGSAAHGAAQTLVHCDDGSSHGYELTIDGEQNNFTGAQLRVNDFVKPYILADMICRNHDIDPTITDGPWLVATCNNVEWNERYNVQYVVSGFTPAKAILFHNETEIATLTCRDEG